MQVTIIASAEVAAADLALGDDGILYITLKPIPRLIKSEMMLALAKHLELIRGTPHPILVDLRRSRSVSREAIQAVKESEVAALMSRCALLFESPVTAMVARFFTAIIQPQFPTKVFRDRDSARAWLLA